MRASFIRPLIFGAVLLGVLGAATALVTAYVVDRRIDGGPFVHPAFREYSELAPGLRLSTQVAFPEEVTALAVSPPGAREWADNVAVGTSPTGGVHVVTPGSIQNLYETVALGLGERVKWGTCNVNAVAFRDLDGDGRAELLASSSQIQPRGRPRLYTWTLASTPEPRGVVRPTIDSSWSHGLGFFDDPETKTVSTFVTYCGFGEVVEFRPKRTVDEAGFAHDGSTWKKVGQLPASGEWLQSADVDNDGRDELCVSTGYAERKAEILIFSRAKRDDPLTVEHRIDEGRKYGNVHFVVGDADGKGRNELVAWWCEAIDGGRCEMIRYRLDSSGVVERTPIVAGDSDDLMPRDGQTSFFDLAGDGRAELYFATRSARVLSYDPSRAGPIETVVRLKETIGPITGYRHPYDQTRTGILIGWKNQLLLLRPETPAPRPRRTRIAL